MERLEAPVPRVVEGPREPVGIAAGMGRVEDGDRHQPVRDRCRRGVGPAEGENAGRQEGARPRHRGLGARENLDAPEWGHHDDIDGAARDHIEDGRGGIEGVKAHRAAQIRASLRVGRAQHESALVRSKAEVEHGIPTIFGADRIAVRLAFREHAVVWRAVRGGKAEGDRMAPAPVEGGFVGDRDGVMVIPKDRIEQASMMESIPSSTACS